jgi:hypothetical protein
MRVWGFGTGSKIREPTSSCNHDKVGILLGYEKEEGWRGGGGRESESERDR